MQIEFYYDSGLAKYNKQDYDGAIADFTKAIELKPDYAEAYYHRGLAKDKKQEYDDAIADFTKAIEFKSDYIDAYSNRGLAKYNKQDYDGAITDFTSVIQFNPKDEQAYSNRGVVKDNNQDYEGAIADLDKAIEINPEFEMAYYNRGLTKSKKQDYDGAIADFTRAIELKPEYAGAYNSRGIEKDNKQDYDDAIADYTKAIEINPEFEMAYSNRGLAKSKKQDYDGAIADYTQAIEINPQFAVAYYNRGLARSKKQDYDGAIADFDKAIELKPEYKMLNRGNVLNKVIEMKPKVENYEKDVEFERSKGKIEKLQSKAEEVLNLGFIGAYDRQAKEKYHNFVKLRFLEAVIYGGLIAILLVLAVSGFFDTLFDPKELTISQMIFMLFVKIGIFVPVYFLVRLINQTANRFFQRSELDNDIAAKWRFFHEKEDEVKLLKDNPDYTELYKNFMEQNIALWKKTNFELLEEIIAKRNHKTSSLKEIDALVDTAKKIKDVYTPSAPTDENNKKS